eukprot:scaffold9250_cov105-Isochrysis_galbana.AAC.11
MGRILLVLAPRAKGGVLTYIGGGGGAGVGTSKSGGYIGAKGTCDGCTGITMGWSVVSRGQFRIVPTIQGMARRDQ